MAPSIPVAPLDSLDVFAVRDNLLDNLPIIVYYGYSTVGNSTQNSSRIQVHLFSLAGSQSFPRITVAPTSPLYAAVEYLPYEKQGDEVRRGLAIGLLEYFTSLANGTKEAIQKKYPLAKFDAAHAGFLASRLTRVQDVSYVTNFIRNALIPQITSWVATDCLIETRTPFKDGAPYGKYSTLFQQLGETAFLPTSSLKRAPSRPKSRDGRQKLAKPDKIALREEMNQLLDTERSYINKIGELVRGLENVTQPASYSTFGEDFARTLRRIFDTNSIFFNRLDITLEETENAAIQDIESENDSIVGCGEDPTGTFRFAEMLLDSVPGFGAPYQEYLKECSDAASLVSRLISSGGPLSAMIYTFGEQKLKSVLIEPVQRLPRYSLIIDNMVNLLPASHQAISILLKAKDALGDICSLESDAACGSEILRRLKRLVVFWPSECHPQGRLVSAVDAKQLKPPFSLQSEGCDGIILLFTDALIFIEKQSASNISARGLLAEIGKPSKPTPSLDIQGKQTQDLEFSSFWRLQDVMMTESEDLSRIRITNTAPLERSSSTFSLTGAHEGKSYRFAGEVVKAKTEGRFPESVRESPSFELRSLNPSGDSVGILMAAFTQEACRESESWQVAISEVSSSNTLNPPKIIFGDLTHFKTQGVDSPVGLTVRVKLLDDGPVSIACYDHETLLCDEKVNPDQVQQTLLKRFGQLLKRQREPSQLPMDVISCDIAFNGQVLRALQPGEEHSDSSKLHRPLSPVKLLSGLIEKSLSSQPSPTKRHKAAAPSTSSIPDLQPRNTKQTQSADADPSKSASASSLGNLFKSSTFDIKDSSASSRISLFRSHTAESKEGSTSSKTSMIRATNVEGMNALDTLEATFCAYIDALRGRCGNITASALMSRSCADELAVNELYNTLIEDPTRIGAAALVPAEVLFSAFEKFVNNAWQDQMGLMVPSVMLESIQAESDQGRPAEFRKCFKSSLDNMAPQSRRALYMTIRLLWDLLDASSNDGDRGMLTSSFTGVIFGKKDSNEYIHLADRMVEDHEDLFSDLSPDASRPTTSSSSAFNSFGRSRAKMNDGSWTSNTSSFRRKFGLGLGMLTRENSQSESPSKVSSVWRALSKNSRSPGGNRSQPSSISKGTLVRSLSTDTDVRRAANIEISAQKPPSTPSPPERTINAYLQDPSTPLSTIKEALSKQNTSVRSHRRSSLSDLNNTAIPSPSIAWSPSLSQRPGTGLRNVNLIRGSPHTSRPTTSRSIENDSPKTSPLTSRIGTGNAMKQLPNPAVSRFGSPSRTTSPSRKENVPFSQSSEPDEDSPKPSRIAMPKASTRIASSLANSPYSSPRTSPAPKTTTATRNVAFSPPKGLNERTWPPNYEAPSASSNTSHFSRSTTSSRGSPRKLPPATSPPPLNIRKLPTAASPPRASQISTKDPFTSTPPAMNPNNASSIATSSHSPHKLKLRSPSKLRARLSAEQRALATASGDLAAEMQAIGLEITASSSAAKINLATATDLQIRLKTLEDRFTCTAASLTTNIESTKKDVLDSLTASERKMRNLEKAYAEVNAENEALYERFNEELGKILGKVKGGEGVGEMRKRIVGLEKEVEGLRRENGRLRIA